MLYTIGEVISSSSNNTKKMFEFYILKWFRLQKQMKKISTVHNFYGGWLLPEVLLEFYRGKQIFQAFLSVCGGPNFVKNAEFKNCFFQIHLNHQKNPGTIKWIQGPVKSRTEESKQALKIILSCIAARAMNCENCQLFLFTSAINISQLRTTSHPPTKTIMLNRIRTSATTTFLISNIVVPNFYSHNTTFNPQFFALHKK